jgi:aminoglycoside phosphotransferase (APT) family kinase protein
LLPSAHAIEREYQVMQALHGTAVPVPRMGLYCEDEGVIGAAFFLMDFVAGRILRDARLPGLSPAERAATYDEANRVIAALHQVDWAGRGLSGYGRTEGFFERLIARWHRQYRASLTTGPIDAMERLADWLPAHIPASSAAAPHTTLTHGDFRLENLIYHPTEPRVLAVLDWELSTLGHPLSDLAYHCMAWHLPGGGVLQGFAGDDLAALGLPSQRDSIARYLARTGRSAELDAVLADWPFYLACNFFRLSAILQGIARRVADGTATSPVAQQAAQMATPVAQWGWAIASGERAAV